MGSVIKCQSRQHEKTMFYFNLPIYKGDIKNMMSSEEESDSILLKNSVNIS